MMTLELPKVPKEKRLGNVAENSIQARLSYFSKTNLIEGRSDIGIDISCELLDHDQPSIPFHVQAKGTEDLDEKWGHSFRKTTIQYWLVQSSPVYLMVYNTNDKKCYWKSIEDIRYWLLDKMNSDSQTIYIQMDKSHILSEGREENKEFIDKVKDDFYLVQMWLGHAYLRGGGYVKMMPNSPRSDIEASRIKENIRTNLYALVMRCFEINDIENLYTYLEFLTNFDKSHYNHFQMFGILNLLLGNKKAARTALSEALAICERDKTWPKDSMDPIKDTIRKQLEIVEALRNSSEDN